MARFAPRRLDWLARDFVAHDCDLKHTIRLILNSRTYQLPYDPRLADRFTRPLRRGRDFSFARPPPAVGRQVFDSIRLATRGQVKSDERAFLDSSTRRSAGVGARLATK